MQERSGSEKAHGVRTHPSSTRGSDRRVLPEPLQSLLELSPAVRSTRSSDRRQGQAEKNLPLVCDALGDSATTAGPGAVYEAGVDRGADEPAGRRRKRHCERQTNAERKTEAICNFRAEANRMKTTAKRAVEMTGLWKTRKTKDRFFLFPTALGNHQR